MMEITEGERVFNTVKRSLDSLGYKGDLSVESAPLVNRIICDLLKATKSFRNMKIENEKLQAELRVQGDLVLPLRNENLKLAKENNELHKLIIKVKDQMDISNNSNESSTKKMQSTNEELQFLLTQKDATIKGLENQVENLRLKLNDIFNQLYMGQGDKSRIFQKGLPKANKIIASENPNQINSTFKKASFDLSSRLDMSSEINYNTMGSTVPLQMYKEEIININNGKAEWAKDLKMAESKAEKISQRVSELESENENLKIQIDTFEKGIKTRDLEIKRLQENIFLGDENKEELKIKYKSEFTTLQNEKLLMQIDFLNKENHRLEAIDYFHNHRCRQEEINRLDEQISNLTKENEKLKKHIEKYGTDKNSMNSSQFRRGSRISVSGFGAGPSLKSQVENLKKDKADLVRLLEEERQKVQTITKELMDTRDDFNSKTNTLKKERDQLSEKYEKLKSEINNGDGIKKINKSDSLEDDLMIKQDLNELKKLDTFEDNNPIDTSSNVKANEKLKSELEELKREGKKKEEEYKKEIQKLEIENSSLREEREKYKKEIENLKKQLSQKKESEMKNAEDFNVNNNVENNKNKNDEEMSNMKMELMKKQDEISKLNFEIKKKDIEYERYINEITKLKSDNEILVHENNLLHTEVENLRNEILELHKDKNEIISNHSLNQSNLEKKNKNLEREVSSLKNQVKNLSDLNNSKQEELDKSLKDSISNLSKSNAEKGNEIEKLKRENAKLKKNLKLFQEENSRAASSLRQAEKVRNNLINKLAQYEPNNYQVKDGEKAEETVE